MRTSKLSIVCMTILAACDVSPVPIAPLAEAPFDSALLGVWQAPNPDSPGDSGTITVLEFRAPEYYIEVPSEGGALDIIRARGFITRIGDVSFMNADELTGKPRGYTFYRYSLAGDTLVVRSVSEASQKFESSEDLRAFLVSNLDADSLYEDPVRLMRVKDTEKGQFP
jgi:hypothetical protein